MILTCLCPYESQVGVVDSERVIRVAGDHIPTVHFQSVGFAVNDPGILPTEVLPILTMVMNRDGSPAGDGTPQITASESGGTLITIPGENFGFGMNNTFDTMVMIGGLPCEI